MEGRSFHTALVGGFRKKDVVDFLAEDKRRQESALQDLQQQLEEACAQLQGAMAERDSALERAAALREQLAGEEERHTATRVELTRLREEQARAGQQLNDARTQREELESRLLAAEQQRDGLVARVGQLEEQAARPGAGADELRALRAELQAQRERAEALDARLRQQPGGKAQPADSMDQLWSLCGKMERTLSQMERLMDGPYRMTCYPDPPADRPLPVESTVLEEELPGDAGPVPAVNPAPAALSREEGPSVKSLLRRIRGK